MLSMPSVSSASNPVTRPALVAEAARPVAPLRAIEPTTAVSKERSRTENRASDASMAAAAAVYTPSGKNNAVARSAERPPPVPENQNLPQPPAEKSEIQKAMELQIKELLSNVWKASAKAVDFLLQRDSTVAAEQAMPSLEPAALLGKKPSETGKAGDANPRGTVTAYNAQGGGLSEDAVATTGQLLDVLA